MRNRRRPVRLFQARPSLDRDALSSTVLGNDSANLFFGGRWCSAGTTIMLKRSNPTTDRRR